MTGKKSGNTTTLTLKKLPMDVRRIIYARQKEAKKRCGCIISMEESLYKIVREWNKSMIEL